MNCNCSNCPARVFYIADFDPAGHGMPVSVLATPHWRKDRHGQPRYLYPIYPTQDPSTLPFDPSTLLRTGFAQDELRAGSAHGSGSISAPTLKPRLQPWPASKAGMNSRPSRARYVR
jgi:hypothetical protein